MSLIEIKRSGIEGVGVFAVRDIAEGEEIAIDYDKIAYLKKPFECRCGSEKCRGLVRGKQ